MSQNLILIRGVQGSGKSTFASKIKTKGCVVLEADMFFLNHAEYEWDPRFLKHAHQWCYSSTVRALKLGQDVIVANTFIRIKDIMPYIRLQEGLFPELNIFVTEMYTRYKNIHGIPESKVDEKVKQFEAIPQDIINIYNIYLRAVK